MFDKNIKTDLKSKPWLFDYTIFRCNIGWYKQYDPNVFIYISYM